MPKEAITDTALARKVESQIFRGTRVAKSKVTVSAAGRVVTLRGEVPTAKAVVDLERATAEVPEVQRVENLLRHAKPRSQKGATARRAPRQRVNTEVRPDAGEPTPAELAAKGEGRQPAPLGSDASTVPDAEEAARATAPREGEDVGA